MDDWQWRAWVGDASGRPFASAFLITPTTLLTCAHVVSGRDDVWVGFPGLTDPLPVAVSACTSWSRPGEDGDAAVLHLAEPVPFTPARLAAPDALTRPPSSSDPHSRAAGRTLTSYGFPYAHEQFERHITVTAVPSMMQRQEWLQLKADAGDRILPGYSGAAVYDPLDGLVHGMITDSDLGDGSEGRIARMLPLSVLRRHWEELDDLLPLAWLTPSARHSLRALLANARTPVPLEELLTEAVGPVPGRRRLRSAWDSVRSVAEGWPGDSERLARWIEVLGRALPGHDLDRWCRTHLAGPADTAERGTASIIVRLERVTLDQAYDLTVHTWIGGAEAGRQETVRVPKRGVRPAVEDGLARARGAMIGRDDWMIEFAVPETLLGQPFEQWYVQREHRLEMGMYPVVVRDVLRMRPDSIRRDQAHRRWRVLRRHGKSRPEAVGCGRPRGQSAFQNWLKANTDVCVLVYGARPVKGWVTAALNMGIPVMAWPRGRCTDPGCTARHQADALAHALADRHPDELPALVKDLRAQALIAPDDQPHCGRDLALLWDDPSRLPDPPLAMEI